MKALSIGIAVAIGCSTPAFCAETGSSTAYDAVIARHSQAYGVPEALVRRVIVRESKYNAGARNGPYYGLMQISHATARSMGYRGAPTGLLDPDVNLTYAVRYLSGAYKTAGGNHDQAVRFYARGYYYDAKRKGLLASIGLGRDGKFTAPPSQPQLASVAPTATPAVVPTTAAAVPVPPTRGAAPVIALATAPALASVAAPAVVVPLPPVRGAAPAALAAAAPAQRVIDPKAGPALAAAGPVLDPATTGSIGLRPSTPLPPARPVVQPAVAQNAPVAPARAAQPAPRTVSAETAPALAYAGSGGDAAPQIRVAPVPPRR